MIIYEKVVNGVKGLYGCKSGIPGSSDEQAVIFKKADGTEVSDLTVATQLRDAGNGQMKKLDGTIVNAWVGQESVIPVGLTPANNTNAEEAEPQLTSSVAKKSKKK